MGVRPGVFESMNAEVLPINNNWAETCFHPSRSSGRTDCSLARCVRAKVWLRYKLGARKNPLGSAFLLANFPIKDLFSISS